jgi:RimJ/RimL family protein N-acetyltransferase
MDVQSPTILNTARLKLRPARLDDASAIFEEYAQDPDVTRYLTWRPNKQVSESKEFLADCLARKKAGEQFLWVITLPSDDRAIGTLACRLKDHKAELGYALAKRFWNQGLMSEAARAVTDWAMTVEPIFRIWAVCDTANTRSARVLEKAGMQREGILRRWGIHPNISAEPRDCFAYSRVRPFNSQGITSGPSGT